MSKVEVDSAQEHEEQNENMEEADEEGMDIKAKALTKLLKTSSVSSFSFLLACRHLLFSGHLKATGC